MTDDVIYVESCSDSIKVLRDLGDFKTTPFVFFFFVFFFVFFFPRYQSLPSHVSLAPAQAPTVDTVHSADRPRALTSEMFTAPLGGGGGGGDGGEERVLAVALVPENIEVNTGQRWETALQTSP